MIYIYNAGPMFTEADIRQRAHEGEMMRETLRKNNVEHMIINPIDIPFDNTKVLTSKEIFLADHEHVSKANVFFFELASGDSGTYVELGNAVERLMSGSELHIYPVFNDIRLQRNQIGGVECPIGFNSYLVGCLSANNIEIHRSFDEAFEHFKKDFSLK